MSKPLELRPFGRYVITPVSGAAFAVVILQVLRSAVHWKDERSGATTWVLRSDLDGSKYTVVEKAKAKEVA